MWASETASTNGRPASEAGRPERAPATVWQERCRRQATVIETLSQAVSTLRRGAAALKAENAELRAANSRLAGDRRLASRTGAHDHDGLLAEVTIRLGPHAPHTARSVAAQRLAGHVTPPVLDSALLLVSELVTNSVQHSGVPEGEDIVVRLHLWRGVCRLEVEDPGCEGMIAPQPAELRTGSGMGLNLVAALSERWGVVRSAEGPTRVWAQLLGAPIT
jgi:anti-sigma regulatory factor (Ser/Thr protein kinase)